MNQIYNVLRTSRHVMGQVVFSVLIGWLFIGCAVEPKRSMGLSDANMVLITNKPNTQFWARKTKINQGSDVGWKELGLAVEKKGASQYMLGVILTSGCRYEIKAENPGYRTKIVKLTEPIPFYEIKFLNSDRKEEHRVAESPEIIAPPRGTERTVIPLKGERWALVVGISAYQDPKIPSIPNAAEDARAVRNYLVNPKGGGYPSDHVFLLTDYDATSRKLRRYLESELRKKVQREDDLFIYFACHGMVMPTPGSKNEDGLEKYLVPYDTISGDVVVDGISMEDLDSIFSALDCHQVAMVLDTCFSGGARSISAGPATRNTTISSSFLKRLGKQQGTKKRKILTACSADELAQDDPDTGHGIFTTYFLEALERAEDMDGDHAITLYEIYCYLSRKVRERSAELGQRQHPEFVGDPAYPFPVKKMDH